MKFFIILTGLFVSTISHAVAPVDCYDFLANPLQSTVFETKNDSYFLMRDDRQKRESYVVKLKTASNKVKRMGIIPSSDSVPFVGHGENNIAISLFSFQKAVSGCWYGRAVGQGFWVGGNKSFKSYEKLVTPYLELTEVTRF